MTHACRSRSVSVHICNTVFLDAKRLPDTLEEALNDLEKDKVMVESLGHEFVEWYVFCERFTKSQVTFP